MGEKIRTSWPDPFTCFEADWSGFITLAFQVWIEIRETGPQPAGEKSK